MGILAEFCEKRGDSLFGGSAVQQPTLNDLLNRVGSDFSLNYRKQRATEDRIRGAMAAPGNSVSTPVYGLRGAIGDGLRALADRYFTPRPLSADNIPGYRRVGQ